MSLISTCLLMHLALTSSSPTLLAELTHQGVRLHGGTVVRLPEPALADGVDATEQSKIVKRVAGKYPLDRFLRDAIVAPFVLDVNSVEDAGQRTGQRVDFYFVAYASLDALLDEAALRDLFGMNEADSNLATRQTIRALTAEELQARNLSPRNEEDLLESYGVIDVPILERVRLSGIGFGARRNTEESIIAAWKLDERFANDPQFANQWRPIVRDAVGRDVLGPPQPYAGAGGYLKITRLIEPDGALFVECHSVFDEPHGWFDGKNLLRSKLPLIVQDNVRTLRRKLANLSAPESSAR